MERRCPSESDAVLLKRPLEKMARKGKKGQLLWPVDFGRVKMMFL